jgi:hypothetical protein
MWNRRDTGDVVKLLGVIAIIAVMSIVLGASIMG